MQSDLMKRQGTRLKNYIKRLPVRRESHFTGFCSNCDHPVDGKFCTNCGQSAKDFRRPFFSVVSESLGDAFSLDNKFFHTLIPLLIRPGYLTKEFMRGRRARYTPPFRLYLFLTFFAFLLLSHNHKPVTDSEKNLTFHNSDGDDVEVLTFVEDILEKDALERDSLVKIIDVQDELNPVNSAPDSKLSSDTQSPSPETKIKAGKELINQNQALQKITDMWRLNPTLMMDTAFKKLSQSLLVILPLFALFLALFYIRRKHYLIEHLLISLNFHSFIFMIVILSELILMSEINFLQPLVLYVYLLIPLQLFLALKFYYKQSWVKSIIKFFLLSFVYNILLVAAILSSIISLVTE